MAKKKLHGSARATREMREAFRLSSDTLKSVATEYGVNPNTVAKWRRRVSVEDAPMGQQSRCSRVLSPDQEELAVTFRKRSKFPLDDCLHFLQWAVPHLTRATLYRCFVRHGVSHIADCPGGMNAREELDLRMADHENLFSELFAKEGSDGPIHQFLRVGGL